MGHIEFFRRVETYCLGTYAVVNVNEIGFSKDVLFRLLFCLCNCFFVLGDLYWNYLNSDIFFFPVLIYSLLNLLLIDFISYKCR